MAKSLLKIQARELRSKGESVKGVARKLNISKSTASLWVRDIILSVKQLEELRKRKIKGGELGRLRNALKQKEKRLKIIQKYNKLGIRQLEHLHDREFLIAGIALYWGEGSKKTRKVEFCNSDQNLVKFMINWLKKSFGIKIEELRCYVGINEIHRKRENIVKNYWSQITDIPLKQFSKTSFKKVKNKKTYENFNEHYGTLSVRVRNPARFYYKILGLIEGLSKAGKLAT